MRRGLVLWHRWFGVLGGVWLFVIALTGSIIVFQAELDAALNRDLFAVEARDGPNIGVERVAQVAAARWPGFAATHVQIPQEPGATFEIYLQRLPGLPLAAQRPQAYVDPHDGRYLGGRDLGAVDLGPRGVVAFIYKLHHTLHAGKTVTLLLGILSALWALDHLAAVALSFPSRARWRDSFRVRRRARGFRLHFDLHRAVGLWLLPVTFVLAFSGVYFNWRPAYDAVVGVVGPVNPRADQAAPKLARPLGRPPVGFDAAIARARVHAPGVVVGAVSYSPAKGLYLVRIFDARDLQPIPQRMVAIDAVTGRLLSDRHMTEGSAADLVTAWQFPLHSGAAFGWPGRLLICAAGLATCGFVVTGLLMWRRKARARGKVAGRAVRSTARPMAGPQMAPAE